MIELKNLTKKYGKFVALSDFNLVIPDNSIFGLVGVNGAGKSTLLRLLSGVFHADFGEVLIDGEDIFENSIKKKEILFLPDEPFFTLNINALGLVDYYKTFYTFDDIVFNQYMSIFKLSRTAAIRSFSKGMKRQLFVCLAFASNPKYLFLDEVFDGLDPQSRVAFKNGLIDLIKRTGGTAILSSHSIKELNDICDSYGIIDGKKIKKSGSLNSSSETVFKFNIAFSKPLKKEDLGFDCLSFESSGRIINIVVRGEKEYYLKKIKTLNPLVIDEAAINFEEFFISELQENKPL